MKSARRFRQAAFAALFTGILSSAAQADTKLVVGDQKGGSRALMNAAGVLSDVPYTIEWTEFVAAAPLMEAMNAGAIDTGIVGDAPFTFAKAAGVHAKAIAAVRPGRCGGRTEDDRPVSTQRADRCGSCGERPVRQELHAGAGAVTGFATWTGGSASK